jgi:hypothetical protein
MLTKRLGMTIVALGFAALALAQEPWIEPYMQGVTAAKAKNWATARSMFQAAGKLRPMDSSLSTTFTIGPTTRETWRKGAPYSANFGGAYAEYQLGLAAGGESGKPHFATAVAELQALAAKGQNSAALYFVISDAQKALGDAVKAAAAIQTAGDLDSQKKLDWRVDNEILTDSDRLAASSMVKAKSEVKTSAGPTGTNPNAPVAIDPMKYAILIGISKYHASVGDVPNAINDCALMKEALTKSTGYDPSHVTILTEPTYEQLLTGVQSFAATLPPGAVVFFMFTGAGRENPADKMDYLIPSGVENRDAFSEFVKKNDLLANFIGKTNRLCAVFQVDRLVESNDMKFGYDNMKMGAYALINACWENERCLTIGSPTGPVGLWCSSAAWVIENKMRGARLDVKSWVGEILQRMLAVNTASGANKEVQTPVLPFYWSLGADATF